MYEWKDIQKELIWNEIPNDADTHTLSFSFNDLHKDFIPNTF